MYFILGSFLKPDAFICQAQCGINLQCFVKKKTPASSSRDPFSNNKLEILHLTLVIFGLLCNTIIITRITIINQVGYHKIANIMLKPSYYYYRIVRFPRLILL